jgi:hypothetical protein
MSIVKKKLLQTKTGSYFLVLPKWFVEMNGLKKGSEIMLDVEDIGKITIIVPKVKTELGQLDGGVEDGRGKKISDFLQ